MQKKLIFIFVAATFSNISFAEHNEVINLDDIEVRAPMIDSRILKHTATVETYDRKQIEDSINAATPAQTLKYLPSIQVRERFIGDRNGISRHVPLVPYPVRRACCMPMVCCYPICWAIPLRIHRAGAW